MTENNNNNNRKQYWMKIHWTAVQLFLWKNVLLENFIRSKRKINCQFKFDTNLSERTEQWYHCQHSIKFSSQHKLPKYFKTNFQTFQMNYKSSYKDSLIKQEDVYSTISVSISQNGMKKFRHLRVPQYSRENINETKITKTIFCSLFSQIWSNWSNCSFDKKQIKFYFFF